jgi:hypothetical protein
MIADRYEPINVLIFITGEPSGDVLRRIRPIRFKRKNEVTYKVQEIRMMHQERHGKSLQYHYTVKTNKSEYCRLMLDRQTLSWRLVEILKEGIKENIN